MADVGVRPARRTDTDAVARIQMRAWQADYRTFVPAAVLAELTGADAAEVWRRRWADAVTAPPSPRHRLLVAVATESVVGFAACGPADEADHDPGTTAELITLRVDPDHAQEGHDSRLLAAVADLLRDDGFRTVITWLFDADEAQRAFFVSAGWAPDGARRTLSFPAPSFPAPSFPAPSAGAAPSAASPPADTELTMIRLHTDIGAADQASDLAGDLSDDLAGGTTGAAGTPGNP